ncbi:MAG: DUF4402 domain-containing protein, partial [Candidatus Subteraquimicrobiales bacterium]|nr:DUF4402 domain-containing protein [Candidatus Subteraquimicrobiales bacterium]
GILLMVLGLAGTAIQARAQGVPFPPPREIRVFTAQGLSFGTFFPSTSSGTVSVSHSGSRTGNGVILAGGFWNQAIFVVELLPGRLVSISIGTDVVLTRTGGGGSMNLSIGPTDKGNSFVTSGGHPFRNLVNVGGTLTVGTITVNPPGEYTGTFSVTFIQE